VAVCQAMPRKAFDFRPARKSAAVVAGGMALAALSWESHARAAGPEWVDRGLTLHQFGLAMEAGLGIAHSAQGGFSGGGVNLDGAFGILDNLEVGLRFGLRVGDADAKYLQADQYARLYDLETFGAGASLFANPELRLLGRVLDLSFLELGAEGRVIFPFANGTEFSFTLGAPVRLHLGRIVRIDTGLYVPVVFFDGGDAVSINLPAEFWFQITRDFFAGPITEIRLNNSDTGLGSVTNGVEGNYADRGAGFLLGIGLGYQLSRFADFKTSFLLPRLIGASGPDFAAGVGVGLHF
jgi:hypothetical protein